MEDWGAVRDRLANLGSLLERMRAEQTEVDIMGDHEQYAADIRAALKRESDLADQVDYWMGKELALRQRVEELEREAGILTQGITDQHDRAEAAEAEVARLREALLRRGISQAPCDICGYCGPEYYQPTTHRCIGESYEVRRASRSTK